MNLADIMYCSVPSCSQMLCSPSRTSTFDLAGLNTSLNSVSSPWCLHPKSWLQETFTMKATQYVNSSALSSCCSYGSVVPVVMFLTLVCSVQQRAPTRQTEESHRRSCTQWRETLGRAQSFWGTHTLQQSCHRPPEQLRRNKEAANTEKMM